MTKGEFVNKLVTEYGFSNDADFIMMYTIVTSNKAYYRYDDGLVLLAALSSSGEVKLSLIENIHELKAEFFKSPEEFFSYLDN